MVRCSIAAACSGESLHPAEALAWGASSDPNPCVTTAPAIPVLLQCWAVPEPHASPSCAGM